MKTFVRTLLFFMLAVSLAGCSGNAENENSVKNWAWLAGDSDMPADELDNYFKKAKESGIDAILLQVHGGYPKGMEDTTDFTDYDAIRILENAVPVAKKYDIELHAWMWTVNRCEKNLRAAHPDWYMVNANDTSCLDIKLYNREHYRWLCPSRPETLEYLKERVAELAKIDGVAGVHLDFIRYPDAILPYGLHESRGVVQDKVYPHWDHCYCGHCRAEFEKLTGRKYGLFEEYKLDDAEVAIVCMNSTAGTTKDVVDSLREKGVKAGLLKVRVFRPFPAEEIAKALSHLKAVAVLDKADSLNGAGGALFTDITSGMQVNGVNVPTSSYVYGLGGRDTTTKEIESVFNDLIEDSKKDKIENPYRYVGLRK